MNSRKKNKKQTNKNKTKQNKFTRRGLSRRWGRGGGVVLFAARHDFEQLNYYGTLQISTFACVGYDIFATSFPISLDRRVCP